MPRFIAALLLGAYFVGGFALMFWSMSIRQKTLDKRALPHPIGFFEPACWVYTFSGRHRGAHDQVLSALVFVWRGAILLLPIGVLALFAS